MTKLLLARATLLATFVAAGANAQTAGLQAELRSSAAILPTAISGAVPATAPAGGVVVGAQAWICDAWQGFAPLIAIEHGIADPLLAVGTTGGVRLPISATTTPATCGQAALQSDGTVYVTQGVVDTKNTPSTARGVLRTALDPNTGAFAGPSTYIATTAGLDGNQPTAAALGPDGNLYVGFLKNGNVKRILSPEVGTTQTVQSVGNTPQGHAARAFAFVGSDLYIASIDALSVIHNATSSSCTGGCNATVIADGFPGIVHTGLTSDGVDTVYFAVAGSSQLPGQVWRYRVSTAQFAMVAQGGADRTGANASNFSFVSAKTNLLTLDAGGNLWIGDDTSNGAALEAGRVWTVSAAALATVPGGSFTGGTNLQAILNVLKGPWFGALGQTQFVPTFNADGTFTASITSPAGIISTDSGTWTLTPPAVLSPFANPQGHLTFTDAQGIVLFSADILLIKADEFATLTTGTGSLGAPFESVFLKQTI